MAIIYLDHNIVVNIAGYNAGQPVQADDLLRHAVALKDAGHQFTFSAWHMYEVARSRHEAQIASYSEFVESLTPLWVSNATKVRTQEIDRFLQPLFDNVGPVRNRTFSPFNATIKQMWSTYGNGLDRPDETFRESITALLTHPESLAHIDRAAGETPKAIADGRLAHRFGIVKPFRFIIDRESLAQLMPKPSTDAQLDYLEQNRKALFAASPTLAVEEAMTEIRRRDGFRPQPSDAVDLQHALVSLGYCDYFVTADGQFAEHCRQTVKRIHLPCTVCRSVLDIEPIAN